MDRKENCPQKDRPKYITHKDADWSGSYYCEALVLYLPHIPGSRLEQGFDNWSCHIVTEKWDKIEKKIVRIYHPYKDLYYFYILKDLKETNMMDRIHLDPHPKKVTLKIFLGRINIIGLFRKYCSNNFSDIVDFLFFPVYGGDIIIY